MHAPGHLEDSKPFYMYNKNILINTHLLRAARTALTAHTGSLVSPTRKVTSHSSGIDARNFMSSARPVLFSNVDKSGSSTRSTAITSGITKTETINFFPSLKLSSKSYMYYVKQNWKGKYIYLPYN